MRNGEGLLAIWHDVNESQQDDFSEWHSREHMPERMATPGFHSGNRYRSISGKPEFFNFYRTVSQNVFSSEAYLQRLNNPTEWTQRNVAEFRNVNRTAGVVRATVGRGDGGAIATIRLTPRAESHADLTEWLKEQGLAETLGEPGIVAAHHWAADVSASRIETRESRMRGSETDVADTTIAIEAQTHQHAAAAMKTFSAELIRRQWVSAEPIEAVYQLQLRLAAAQD